MIETHPFGSFVPPDAKYLMLGSFPGKLDEVNNWFYSTKKGQFWQIFEIVFKTNLKTIKQKENLLTKQKIALSDVIYKCQRSNNNNSDLNLKKITYNNKNVLKILQNYKIEKIIFTSKFVETKFKIHFKEIVQKFPSIKYITLPSPSPRYAKLSLNQKAQMYSQVLLDKK